ncbi:hypothetical protein HOY34_01990 [Xinfangfangia sp. D13-10-4-6]|uniref:TadE/TadG family type IV pilus assembly protein n=1 Tax=Pseudogemmobacter hezensis TaxID=2737662 RepID=UPI001555A4F1|nr:hypothetical protein [Pseudogemmobacter hezensis]NPD13969.1 hypothetical protein [Pseudogemmobacter hezensis]
MTEFLLVLPLLIWAFLAMMVYWDTWRTINESQKAAYVVADLVSRQSTVNLPFINGMQTVMEALIGYQGDISLRITSIQWNVDPDTNEGSYSVIFSRSPRSAKPALTAQDVEDLAYLIPELNPSETTVIVETWLDFTPAAKGTIERDGTTNNASPRAFLANIGISDQTFRNFIVTKPRGYRSVCLAEQIYNCPFAEGT